MTDYMVEAGIVIFTLLALFYALLGLSERRYRLKLERKWREEIEKKSSIKRDLEDFVRPMSFDDGLGDILDDESLRLRLLEMDENSNRW